MNAVSYLRRVTASLALSAALAPFVLMPMASANAAGCHFYTINIQGVATLGDATATAGYQQFVVSQYAMWRDVGVASHPVEFMLTPLQDLNAAAQPGQIELMTNSAFARNAGIASARYDLAAVSVANNVIRFEMDSGMSFQLPPPNVFVSPGLGGVAGGLGGLGFLPGAGGQLGQIINSAPILSVSYFVPRTGGGYFYSPDGQWASIAGELNLVGTGIDNTSFQGQYQASFYGNYIGSVECN